MANQTPFLPLHDRIVYPQRPTRWTQASFDALPRYRTIHSKGKPKTYTWNDTVYLFESSAEKRIFIWLTKVLNPVAIKLQSYQIPREKPHRHYTPDFQVLLHDGTLLLVEVKSILDHLDPSIQSLYSLFKTYGETHGLAILWVDPHRHAFASYLDPQTLNMPSLRPLMHTLFQSKQVTKAQYEHTRHVYNPSNDRRKRRKFDRYFTAYALQHGYRLNQSYRNGDWTLVQLQKVA
jgi:hypothetical protein